jgi:ComF family protein
MLQGSGFCFGCWSQLSFVVEPICQRCGIPLPVCVELCGPCYRKPFIYLQAHRSVSRYNELSKNLIVRLKHSRDLALAPLIGRLMYEKHKAFIDQCHYIVPVPIHWSRWLYRRFNQAGLIAQTIAKASNKPFIPHILLRHKKTTPQQGSKTQRISNVAHAFCLQSYAHEKIRHKNILLIDDVFTTGATLESCAATLIKTGKASTVKALTFAQRTFD